MTDPIRPFDWRDWPSVFDSLPSLQGQTVLDLGCGAGDWAAEFSARGASVIRIDLNQDALREARSRQIHAEFREADLRALPDLGVVEEFLDCLQRPDHTSSAKVYFCLATVGRGDRN